MLTDGLAGAESRMIGIIGLHHKAARERHFPLHLLEKGLKVKIEELAAGLQETFAVLMLFGEPFMHLDDRLNGQVHGPLFILLHLHFMYVTSQKWLILI